MRRPARRVGEKSPARLYYTTKTGIGMDHLNWVQQNEDYNTKYYILKWKTSHFHEPFSNHMAGSAKLKDSAAAPVAAKETSTEQEGLGLGLADKNGSGRFKFGLGFENAAARNVVGADAGRDGVSISTLSGLERGIQTAGAVQQSAALVEVHAAENTITSVSNSELKSEAEERKQADREKTTVAQTGRGNIRNRLRESASRLMEAYRKYKEKAAKIPLRRIKQEKTELKEKKGTRTADRETMLAMQAENHYLLDSYDQTGNYSMLGKK